MFKKEISIKNQLTQLEVLVNELEILSEEWELPMSISLNLNLVLEELITNTIFYGYEDQNEHFIQIEISIENQVITMRITDDGKEFNPLLMAEPDIELSVEERKIGGLGIHFVRKLMDEVTYFRSAEKNILTLKKSILPN
ncbi:MAG: ATP-binding protein [Bacteroidales bacterium]|jgi:serine/threonine-protein kinase RsbW